MSDQETDVMDDAAETSGSIIGAKYKDRYREPDWIGEIVNKFCKKTETKMVEEKDEEGNVISAKEVSVGRPKLDLDDFFELCEQNKIDTREMRLQRDRKNAPGRIRMTLGNSLRAAARKRGGLFDTAGNWMDAPVSITGGNAPTETQTGEPIRPAKEPETDPEADPETEE